MPFSNRTRSATGIPVSSYGAFLAEPSSVGTGRIFSGSASAPVIASPIFAFATPMYYYGISPQLKAVIDRFYAINGDIHVSKKAVLLMTYANGSPREASPILTHYEVLLEYLGWQDAGRIVAPGVWPVGAINGTPFPERAYELGKRL